MEDEADPQLRSRVEALLASLDGDTITTSQPEENKE
jgi:hypothetical protein